ncbi:unnamed protein product [Pleuronectes platessa]|uniref:Uncharacterized protein n=1 Tax=Pleuronectes platessa TaxID=8262 RepID=A0A9N7TZB4_PLEPL|nr:unnamed protein product [Pleuronectes platessa]
MSVLALVKDSAHLTVPQPDLRHWREECDVLTLSELPSSPSPLTLSARPAYRQQPLCPQQPPHSLQIQYVFDMAGMLYADVPVVGDKFESKEMSGWQQLWATISPDVRRC